MFGGFGVFHEGLMFAIVVNETLYLKTDVSGAQAFEELGLMAFEYLRAGKTVKLSYYLTPSELLDDPDALLVWSRRSIEAALRARNSRES